MRDLYREWYEELPREHRAEARFCYVRRLLGGYLWGQIASALKLAADQREKGFNTTRRPRTRAKQIELLLRENAKRLSSVLGQRRAAL
jgi:hypothetical protein